MKGNLWAVTFNAPGATGYKKGAKSKRIRNIVRRGDVVGRFGTHIGSEIVYPDVKFNFKKDTKAKSLYLLRNHNIDDFIPMLRKRGR